MKKSIILSLSIFMFAATILVAKEKITKTTNFKMHLHCEDCKNKIEANIPFQKGVKDLFVNIDTNVVTVVYNPEKTDSTEIAAAFKRLDFKVE